MKIKKSTILYIDDEISNIFIFKKLFDGYYNIITALSGFEGLQMLEKHQIELVITDQRMPKMSGLEFLKKVTQKWPNIKSIMLSAYSDMDITYSVIKDLKVLRYITKPFDQIEMKLLIDWAIELQLIEIEE